MNFGLLYKDGLVNLAIIVSYYAEFLVFSNPKNVIMIVITLENIELESSLREYTNISPEDLAESNTDSTIIFHTYMNCVLDYIQFLANVKEYTKKQLHEKELVKEEAMRKERVKKNALKGTKKMSNNIVQGSPKPIIKFETKVNIMVHDEEEKVSDELRIAEEAVEEKKKYIKTLNKKKNEIIRKMNKEQAEKEKKEKYEDEKNYRIYQKEQIGRASCRERVYVLV